MPGVRSSRRSETPLALYHYRISVYNEEHLAFKLLPSSFGNTMWNRLPKKSWATPRSEQCSQSTTNVSAVTPGQLKIGFTLLRKLGLTEIHIYIVDKGTTKKARICLVAKPSQVTPLLCSRSSPSKSQCDFLGMDCQFSATVSHFVA